MELIKCVCTESKKLKCGKNMVKNWWHKYNKIVNNEATERRVLVVKLKS